jgi:hypothetical protein
MNLHFDQYQSALYESASKLRGGSQTPIPLRPICRQLGVCGIRRDKLDGAKSLLVDASVKPVIILNESLMVKRTHQQKFTKLERFLIAHELGHLVLHQLGAKNPSGQSEYWKLEKLCDAFARRLLIPDDAVEVAAGDCAGLTAIERLKFTLQLIKSCRVPWSVGAHRLADVNSAVIFLRVDPLIEDSGFKIVVSTGHNHQGIGQKIRPGAPLYTTLCQLSQLSDEPREIKAENLSGIAGIKTIRSGASYPFEGSLRLAVIPA